MTEFIDWLEKQNKSNTRVRAVLRRSLSFDPGSFAQAYPYVEPFLKNDENVWRRKVFYLVAGLWAAHWRDERSGEQLPIGKACAVYKNLSGSSSTESRFMILLDADADQLPHYLRQMTALLKDQNIDFPSLLKGLLYWNDEQKRTQNTWARDFYRNIAQENELETASKEMENE